MASAPGSLRSIFLLWHPQTSATLDERLAVLDVLRSAEPDVAWSILLQIIPTSHDVASPTSRPEWRPWAPAREERITYKELDDGIRAVVSRLVEDVGEGGRRWSELVGILDDVPPSQFDVIASAMSTVAQNGMRQEDKTELWGAIRQLISKHLEYPDAEWALSDDKVDQLQEIYQRLTPANAVARVEWLFRVRPDLPEAGFSGWEERSAPIAERQVVAVSEIYELDGLEGILELGQTVEDQWSLGRALGSVVVSAEEYRPLIERTLRSDDEQLHLVGLGYIAALASERLDVLRSLIHEEDWTLSWPARSRAELYLSLPFDERTWEELGTEPTDVEREYWRFASPFGRGTDFDRTLAERATREWLSHSQPVQAIHMLALYRPPATAELALDAIRELVEHPPNDARVWSDLGYQVADLLDIVRSSKVMNDSDVGRLEWVLLPVLSRVRHDFEPRTLNRLLASDPSLFVEVLGTLYRRKGSELVEPSADQQARATQAFELLHGWSELPGKFEGGVDLDALRSWVKEARQQAKQAGLEDPADSQIGQVLANAPEGSDGIWPHESVRAVIDEFANEELLNGFIIGVLNSRGFSSRAVFEGGAQERELAQRYSAASRSLAARWPRTATALARIAESYESDARRQDVRAELEREEWE